MDNQNIISKIPKNNMVAKSRNDRPYLISDYTSHELNTYTTFKPFNVFNDVYASTYKDGKEVTRNKTIGDAKGVRSIFNAAGAVMTGLGYKQPGEDGVYDHSSEWRISNNVPLMDSPENRERIRQNSDCTVKALVKASQEGMLGREVYSYADFMYCKHLGKVSNNYLITLRRFPIPVDDYISSMGEGKTKRNKDITSRNVTQVGCLVSWMGTPGNDMSNILKYSVSMPFQSKDADWQDASVDADSSGGLANSIAAAFDPTYRNQFMQGIGGNAMERFSNKFFSVKPGPYSASQFTDFRDSNKVYGPVDAIKSTYVRSSDGIKFDQNITIVFDYELRSYNGINGRQAMLDLLSNILNVTYTTGTFWGGGYRGGGAHQNNIFTNLQSYKAKGGFTSFIDAFAQDYSTLTKSFGNVMDKYDGNFLQMAKSALNQLGGMMLGGMLNKLGRPAKVMANSLLSPAPVGFWHLTIGNPHHPIMSMGNMILTNTEIEHYGPLGLDDFPTGIRVTCTLTRGKPRDLRDIEKLYMHGNDRIYSSMGPKVFDMYKNAKDYNGVTAEKHILNTNKEAQVDTSSRYIRGMSMSPTELRGISDKLVKYFGHNDTYSIYVAAAEQEYGSNKPTQKDPSHSGDSRAKGTGGMRGGR